MPAYWWQCQSCPSQPCVFSDCGPSAGIYGFLWDELLPSGWDQSLLKRNCPNCKTPSLQITYKFPRRDESTATVTHIVGLNHGDWMAMMWETVLDGDATNPLFDFKYLQKGRFMGLNRPAVFSRSDLQTIFRLYCDKTGKTQFP